MKKLHFFGLFALVLAAVFTGCRDEKQPDTIKWFNTTYAVLTAANKGNLNKIGGYNKSDSSETLVKNILEEYWNITDRASADETLDRLLNEGHRAQFLKEMSSAEIKELLSLSPKKRAAYLSDFGYPESGIATFQTIAKAYKKYGEHTIDAWDYCRALQLLGYYYLAGYYTKEEALDESLEASKILQSTYNSWDEMMESYLLGCQYRQNDDINDPESASAQRKKVYEDLSARENSPYLLDWNTPLEKSW